ncbi:MAG: serine/threonine protein kinase [Candidatus Hydrogenedentes bacterium]|nr:serine/threonine protein kinase [Candidatus Hydrogenedentota bacterium]
MESAKTDMTLAPGVVVADRYEILDTIGKGGMGEVYLAKDRQTGGQVAIKTLRARYLTNKQAIARFVREVNLVRQMNHPGIIKIYDAQKWENTLFYAMEYLEGKSLRLWLRQKGQLDLASTVRVLCLVASALQYAHNFTIHRDLSPENIMVLRDGTVRLLDFGLAKLDDQFKGLTMVGANLGKLRYMAPEQELNAAEVDHRADLYPLGLMLFEMLAGKLPAPGEKLTSIRPDLPAELDDFIAKATARDPNERFQSAQEFRDELLAIYKRHVARTGDQKGEPRAAISQRGSRKQGLFGRILEAARRLIRR